MKIPDRLIGFVEYDSHEIAFEFDQNEYVIRLYPQKDLWKQYSRPSYVFGKNKVDYTVHEWIPENRLIGTTSAGFHVVFDIQDHPSVYSGFLSFRVHWYFLCTKSMADGKFQGFSLSGDIIDSFFSPSIAIEQKHEFDGTNNIPRLVVSSTCSPTMQCGQFDVTDTVAASFEVDAISYASLGNFEQPIYAKSKFITTFSEPTTIETIIETFQTVIRFFIFISYRSNISFEKLDLFVVDDKKKRDYQGIIVFPPVHNSETNPDAKRNLIVYNDIRERTAIILDDIRTGILSIQHICDSYDATRTYPISRVILVLAAFERLYGGIYGKDTDRSDVYIETKEQVVKLIEQYANACTGKQKGYAKTLKKFVENRDSSYASNMIYALRDCKDIMVPFVSRRYKGEYDEIIEDLGNRIGEIRNGVAHFKLNFDLEPIHLSDIHIAEELFYAVELKHIGLSTRESQIAINRLFREHIYFKEETTDVQEE